MGVFQMPLPNYIFRLSQFLKIINNFKATKINHQHKALGDNY